MTRILVDPRRDAIGGSQPVGGVLTATPTRLREDGAVLLYPGTLTWRFHTDRPIVELDAPGASWAWLLVLSPDEGRPVARTVQFSGDSVEWDDLTDVDPATLEPVAEPAAVAAWEAAAARVDAFLADPEPFRGLPGEPGEPGPPGDKGEPGDPASIPPRLAATGQQVTTRWDDVTAAGLYYGNALPDGPLDQWLSVIVTSSAGDATGTTDGAYCQQTAMAWFVTAVWVRQRTGSTWTPWTRLVDRAALDAWMSDALEPYATTGYVDGTVAPVAGDVELVAEAVTPRYVKATRTDGVEGAVRLTQPDGFHPLPLTLRESSDPDEWDGAAWAVPRAGLYAITASVRVGDGSTPGINVGVGVDIANRDSPDFAWYTTSSALRTTFTYARTQHFSEGDPVRLFAYVDSSDGLGISAAALSLTLIAADPA